MLFGKSDMLQITPFKYYLATPLVLLLDSTHLTENYREYWGLVVPGVLILHAHVQAGGYVIRAGVHLHVYMYMTPQKVGTLAVDLPFQTLAVDFSSNLDQLYHCALQKCFLIGFPYLMRTLLYLSEG